jgi:hypothetical protein
MAFFNADIIQLLIIQCIEAGKMYLYSNSPPSTLFVPFS